MDLYKNLRLSELTAYIKDVIDFGFTHPVWVIAEISQINIQKTKGHAYLELIEKDADTDEIKSKIRATIWASKFYYLNRYFEEHTGSELQRGFKILVRCIVNFHEIYGLSLNIIDIEPSYTLGEIHRQKQETIQRLKEEGIFDMNQGVAPPVVIQRIAIISSPTAAGYEDFVRQLEENKYGIKFFHELFPTVMQGEEAVDSVLESLDAVLEHDEYFEVVVIIRGGGAISELSVFDDYRIAETICQYPLPVFTGIGHERDLSVADMVANQSFKTPTAVAQYILDSAVSFMNETESIYEQIVFNVNNAISVENLRLKSFAEKIKSGVKIRLAEENNYINIVSERLVEASNMFFYKEKNRLSDLGYKINFSVMSLINNKSFELNRIKSDILRGIRRIIENENVKLDNAEKLLSVSSPENILRRGFSYTQKDGQAVLNAKDLNEGDIIETYFYKGKVTSVVSKKSNKN